MPEAGLAGEENGELLSMAEERGFQVLVTMDKGFEYEQNLSGRAIALLVLHAKSNQIDDLLPLVLACLIQLRSIKSGQLARVGN